MNGFIEWLEKLNEKDTKVRAVLRRSLTFDPGAYVPAYPYVEPFIKGEDKSWRREMYLLSGRPMGRSLAGSSRRPADVSWEGV